MSTKELRRLCSMTPPPADVHMHATPKLQDLCGAGFTNGTTGHVLVQAPCFRGNTGHTVWQPVPALTPTTLHPISSSVMQGIFLNRDVSK